MMKLLILLSLIISLPSLANSGRCYISKTRDVIEQRTQPPSEGYECIVECIQGADKTDYDIMEFDERGMIDKLVDWATNREALKVYGCKLNKTRLDDKVAAKEAKIEAAKNAEALKKAESETRMGRIKTECATAKGLTKDLCEELLSLKNM